MIDSVKTGSFIREQRRKQGLSQNALAERLLVSREAVSKWENGHNLPDISIMGQLAEVLGTSIDEILAGESADNTTVTENPAKKNSRIPVFILLAGFLVLFGVLVSRNHIITDDESLKIGYETVFSSDSQRQMGQIYYFEYDPDVLKWQNVQMMSLDIEDNHVLIFNLSRRLTGRDMKGDLEVLAYVRYGEENRPYDLVIYYPGNLKELDNSEKLDDLLSVIRKNPRSQICEFHSPSE